MSAVELHKSHTVFPLPYQKLLGWVFLVGSLPTLIWVVLAGLIAVPHPSYLALRGGPAMASLLAGIGLLASSHRLLSTAVVVFLLGILGWFVLP